MAPKILCSLFALLLLCAGRSVAQTSGQTTAPPATPDTPAGRTLQTWLDAFNSGDRTKLEA